MIKTKLNPRYYTLILGQQDIVTINLLTKLHCLFKRNTRPVPVRAVLKVHCYANQYVTKYK